MDEFYLEFLKCLNENKVEYLLIGGHAVIAHGVVRNTGDMDIWINPTQDNHPRFLKAVDQFGWDTSEMSLEIISRRVVRLKQYPDSIECLHYIAGVYDFNAAYQNKMIHEVAPGHFANVIGYHELIKNKQGSAREKDLSDIQLLYEIKSETEQKRRKDNNKGMTM